MDDSNFEEFSNLWYNSESVETKTSIDQCDCEEECAAFLKSIYCYSSETLEKLRNSTLFNVDNQIRLLRSFHHQYIFRSIDELPKGFLSLDPSRPWICFWILHALYLLEFDPPPHITYRFESTIKRMQNKSGGFSGGTGPFQISQCAPNFAAVSALVTIGTMSSLSIIDRSAMYNFFLSMKQPDGSFTIHQDGEMDTRSSYTILAVARILNILTPELTTGCVDFLLSCQTYEGGFGGAPHNEAHGGYTYCALAALMILGEVKPLQLVGRKDVICSIWRVGYCVVRFVPNLFQDNICLKRVQIKLEGGFQGRTNKLVDSCYSFWQGAALAMVEIIRNKGGDVFDMEQYFAMRQAAAPVDADGDIVDLTNAPRIQKATRHSGNLPFNQKALQKYLLHCAQNLESGGMRDKPGKHQDLYHSCYALSGLSIAQSCMATSFNSEVDINGTALKLDESDRSTYKALPQLDHQWKGPQVYGDTGNLLQPTSVVYNVGLDKLHSALDYFQSFESSHAYLISQYKASVDDKMVNTLG